MKTESVESRNTIDEMRRAKRWRKPNRLSSARPEITMMRTEYSDDREQIGQGLAMSRIKSMTHTEWSDNEIGRAMTNELDMKKAGDDENELTTDQKLWWDRFAEGEWSEMFAE